MDDKERLRLAEEALDSGSYDKETIEYIFPELAESEDEKIRKELIAYCQVNMGHTWHNIKQEDYITWLEKQGEQKPDANCLLSWSETDEKMLQSLEGIVKDYWAKAEQEKNEIKIREASNVSYFLKTIQKSPLCWIKCSDGLPNRDGIYLVVTDGRYNDVYDMARYDSIEGWHKASEIIYWMPIPQLTNKSIIEQKSAAWSEDDERHIDTITSTSLLEDRKKEQSDWGVEVLNEEIAWLKSLKDRVLPKREWSEEDEKHLNRAINILDASKVYTKSPDKYEDTINWLKSLRPPYYCDSCKLKKSIEGWKPSEEQMYWLRDAIDNSLSKPSKQNLESLYNELKKLKD